MAIIGTFADIVFEANRSKVNTFEEIQHEGGARLATHEVLNREPLTEFLGPAGETISFTMRLLAELGVDPTAEYEKVQKICRTGTASAFVLGGKPYGGSGVLWIIEKFSSSQKHFIGGNPRMIDVDVTLRRYVTW